MERLNAKIVIQTLKVLLYEQFYISRYNNKQKLRQENAHWLVLGYTIEWKYRECLKYPDIEHGKLQLSH